MPSLNQLAREIGLSKATVSRALSGHPKVAPATRERVLRAAAESGYQPSAAMRSAMRAAGSRGARSYVETLACVTLETPLDHYRSPREDERHEAAKARLLLRGIEERADALGCHIDCFALAGHSPGQLSRILRSRGMRRIILCPVQGFAIDRWRKEIEAIESEFPLVLVGVHDVAWAHRCVVQVDFFTAGAKVYEKAEQAGYRKVVLLPGLARLNTDGRFVAGLRHAAEALPNGPGLVFPKSEASIPDSLAHFPADSCLVGSLNREDVPAACEALRRENAPGWIDWHANIHDPRFGIAGIDRRDADLGRKAVDYALSASLLDSDRINSPQHVVLVEPEWVDGGSL